MAATKQGKTRRTTQQPAPGRRVWMTRGLRPDHHDRLRKVAAFLPKGTIQMAHDRVLEAGLPVVERELGIAEIVAAGDGA
jgi:hypothetical protein